MKMPEMNRENGIGNEQNAAVTVEHLKCMPEGKSQTSSPPSVQVGHLTSERSESVPTTMENEPADKNHLSEATEEVHKSEAPAAMGRFSIAVSFFEVFYEFLIILRIY